MRPVGKLFWTLVLPSARTPLRVHPSTHQLRGMLQLRYTTGRLVNDGCVSRSLGGAISASVSGDKVAVQQLQQPRSDIRPSRATSKQVARRHHHFATDYSNLAAN